MGDKPRTEHFAYFNSPASLISDNPHQANKWPRMIGQPNRSLASWSNVEAFMKYLLLDYPKPNGPKTTNLRNLWPLISPTPASQGKGI